MKRHIQFISLFITLLLVSAIQGWGYARGPEGGCTDTTAYECVRRQGGINLYTRWIPTSSGRRARQVMVEFSVDTDMEDVIHLLSDENACSEWMLSTEKYYRIRTVSEMVWYCYVQFSIPWPLKNQDCILKYEVCTSPDSSKRVIRVSGVPDYLGEQDGVERISHIEITWVVMQKKPGTSMVQYIVFSEQPPKFPTWLTDPIIQKNTIKTMKALQDLCRTKNVKYVSS